MPTFLSIPIDLLIGIFLTLLTLLVVFWVLKPYLTTHHSLTQIKGFKLVLKGVYPLLLLGLCLSLLGVFLSVRWHQDLSDQNHNPHTQAIYQQYQASFEKLKQAYQTNPSEPYLSFLIGRAAFRFGQSQLALSHLEKAYDLIQQGNLGQFNQHFQENGSNLEMALFYQHFTWRLWRFWLLSKEDDNQTLKRLIKLVEEGLGFQTNQPQLTLLKALLYQQALNAIQAHPNTNQENIKQAYSLWQQSLDDLNQIPLEQFTLSQIPYLKALRNQDHLSPVFSFVIHFSQDWVLNWNALAEQTTLWLSLHHQGSNQPQMALQLKTLPSKHFAADTLLLALGKANILKNQIFHTTDLSAQVQITTQPSVGEGEVLFETRIPLHFENLQTTVHQKGDDLFYQYPQTPLIKVVVD